MSLFKSIANAVLSNVGVRMSLEEATKSAPRRTGVYKLYLNGKLMKVGKATRKEGIRWRMQQYWRGDSTAGKKHGRDIQDNRERISVQWVICSKDNCRELEIKLQNQVGGIDNLPWCDRA
ncbi:hypothetical protein [Salipaludibacillus daqingensis]|uniref:hypothetical protein n=1 Tax=Salipaludibacillus daqingensis TaxID=3041001 RepID=UPI002475E3EF|nr:hypothetical protein [Salipaludibacillus daqingensis]